MTAVGLRRIGTALVTGAGAVSAANSIPGALGPALLLARLNPP